LSTIIVGKVETDRRKKRMARKSKTQPKAATTAVEPTNQQRYFRVVEAAAYLRCAKWAVAAAIRTKKLPYIPVGKRYVLLREDLDAFAASQRVAA
jgi:excisionase family DNA binding protein